MNKQILACLENPNKGAHIDDVLEHFTLVHPEEALRMADMEKRIQSAKVLLKEGCSYSIPKTNYRTHLLIKSLGREKKKKEFSEPDTSLCKCAHHMAEILCAYEEDITLSAVSCSNGFGELETNFIISSEANGDEPIISMIRSVYGTVETKVIKTIPKHKLCMFATAQAVFHSKKEEKQDSNKAFENYESWISGVLSSLPSEGNYVVQLRFYPIKMSQHIENYQKQLNEHYRKLHFFGDYNWGTTVNMGLSVNEGQDVIKTTVGMDSQNYNAGYSMNLSGRDIYKEALLLTEEIEQELARLKRGNNTPLWAVEISVSTECMETMQTVISIMTGLVQEADIRLHWSAKSSVSIFPLNTKELLPLLLFPTKEFCGFRFVEKENFSLVSPSDNKQGFPIGNILWNGMSLSSFYLSPKALSRHTFICGMTGAGKTNTLFKIIESIPLPFCVIEPVKGEYRALRSIYPNLKIWTMKLTDGNDATVSMMRMNPFWFPHRGSLAFHIDSLKTIIASSFELTAAMPNILEQCLYNVYVKTGWDLVTNQNIYWDKVPEEYLYPTFSDLCSEIEDYLEKSDFSGELMGDYKGALLSRMKSFVRGYKGILLNTNVHPDYHAIMQGHTILELEGLADDADKCLVMGTILVQYYQYLKLHFKSLSGECNLQHLLVIEEAHRLFKNTRTEKGKDGGANPTGQLVNLLSNMMAEIRAFGEGMLIVDQSPTKVAEDVIKNSATKIVHRIDNHNDIKALQSAMLLPDEILSFASLKQGEGLIRADGMVKPCKVKMLCSMIKESYALDASFQTFDSTANPLASIFIASSVLSDEKICKLVIERIVVFLDCITALRMEAWYETIGFLLCDIQDILRKYKKFDIVGSRMSVLFEMISMALKQGLSSESRKDFGIIHMFVMRLLAFFRDKKEGQLIKQGAIDLFRDYLDTNVTDIWKNYRLQQINYFTHNTICKAVDLNTEDMFAIILTSYIADMKMYVEDRKQSINVEKLLYDFLENRITYPAREIFIETYGDVFKKLEVWLSEVLENS